MTVSVLASGQIGSDGTGNISGAHNPGGGITPHFVAVFVIGNGDVDAGVDTVTYGGVNMNLQTAADDASGAEDGFCYAYYLDRNSSIPSGSQTVSVAFTTSVTRRVYCVSFATDGDGLESVNSDQDGNGVTNPSSTYSAGTDYVSGVAALFYGGSAASVSVANGAQLAEADFSGGSQCASLIWANTTVTGGDVTIGWTAAADEGAATWMFFREMVALSGNVTLSASPVENASVVVTHPSNGNVGSVLTDASGDWEVIVAKGSEQYVYCYYENGGNKYTADLHWGMSTT